MRFARYERAVVVDERDVTDGAERFEVGKDGIFVVATERGLLEVVEESGLGRSAFDAFVNGGDVLESVEGFGLGKCVFLIALVGERYVVGFVFPL